MGFSTHLPFFLLPGVMTWERPASHPPGGTPGWNALWSLRPTSRCGWWTARGPGRSTAAAAWRRRTARMDRWGWGWMGKFQQLGHVGTVFRKNNLKIIIFLGKLFGTKSKCFCFSGTWDEVVKARGSHLPLNHLGSHLPLNEGGWSGFRGECDPRLGANVTPAFAWQAQ